MLHVYGPLYTKKGVIAKNCGDLDNYCKMVLDACATALSFNDSLVVEIELKRLHAEEWSIRLGLSPLPTPCDRGECAS